MQVQQVLQWVHNHWSPNPPESYRYLQQGKLQGYGAHFAKHVAEFNMAWATTHGKLETEQDHKLLAFHMEVWKVVLDEEVNGYPLREWVCMYKPEQLDLKLSSPQVDRSVRKIMRPTVRRAVRLRQEVCA